MIYETSEVSRLATFRSSRIDCLEGRPTSIRLYRVARPSILGGHSAFHLDTGWQYGVEGEWLTNSRELASRIAAENDGEAQDVTRKYTGSVYD